MTLNHEQKDALKFTSFVLDIDKAYKDHYEKLAQDEVVDKVHVNFDQPKKKSGSHSQQKSWNQTTYGLFGRKEKGFIDLFPPPIVYGVEILIVLWVLTSP